MLQREKVGHKDLTDGEETNLHMHGGREKGFCIVPFENDRKIVVGDGKTAFTIPASMNGMNLVDAVASVYEKGIKDTTDVQIRRRREGVDVNMLFAKITIGDEYFATDEAVDEDNDDVQTGDQIYIDIFAVHSKKAPKGLSVTLDFRLP